MRLLIGVTGSVATIKLPELLELLERDYQDVHVKILGTSNSLHFIHDTDLRKRVLTDKDEWEQWQSREDPILHIELRRWADALIIAPLDANTMAKAAHGICDNLLTCLLRAWDFSKPIAVCPAMNTAMWEHPLTRQHMAILESLGYRMIAPIEKRLACGDVGLGAMASVESILEEVSRIHSHFKTA